MDGKRGKPVNSVKKSFNPTNINEKLNSAKKILICDVGGVFRYFDRNSHDSGEVRQRKGEKG
jgi:hypothetical protein